MKSFFNIIRYDYAQRTRSYAFLITLCLSLAMAYTFVPEPNANYSTLRIANYLGYYNSAWFGYVTAIMTSIFLSLIGFYLVNSGIKTDVDTKVGQIVAATPIRNLKYLFAKTCSNFLVLLTIMLLVFVMSILLFFLYNAGFPFEFLQFAKPYLLITIPSLCIVSALALAFEVLLGKYSVVQNIGFFIVFIALAMLTPKNDSHFMFDAFGTKIVTHQMEESVRTLLPTNENIGMTIGYVAGNIKETKKFEFTGVDFTPQFIFSRIAWMIASLLLIVVIAPFFHRFNRNTYVLVKSQKNEVKLETSVKEIILSTLPVPEVHYGIIPILKTEFLLLIRQGEKWMWLLNFLGIALLALLPLQTAHQFVLPILWFLQIGRLSELTTKEITYGVHYFAFSSFKPLTRLLLSQVAAGVVFILFLSMPLLARYAWEFNLNALLAIVLGGTGIVLFASALGIITKGKKLFEVLFFMITYANINGIIFMDYFGGFTHPSIYLLKLSLTTVVLAALAFLTRSYQLRS